MDLSKLTLVELKNMLRERNLDTTGERVKLLVRLHKHVVEKTDVDIQSVGNSSNSSSTETQYTLVSNEEYVVGKLRDDISALQQTIEMLSQRLQSNITENSTDVDVIPCTITPTQSTTTTPPNASLVQTNIQNSQPLNTNAITTPIVTAVQIIQTQHVSQQLQISRVRPIKFHVTG